MLKTILNLIKIRLESFEKSRYDEYTFEKYLKKKGYRVGNNNRIYIRDFGTEPYLIKIGDHCTITTGVKFITHDGGAWIFRKEIPELNVFGKIEIKDNCFIGVDSIILPGVTVGPNSVVGAGSVVTKDVPPNSVVAGVPAKMICAIEDYKQKCLEKWRSINLKGQRDTWKNQLIKYFWEEDK